jgi:hypothetical protein
VVQRLGQDNDDGDDKAKKEFYSTELTYYKEFLVAQQAVGPAMMFGRTSSKNPPEEQDIIAVLERLPERLCYDIVDYADHKSVDGIVYELVHVRNGKLPSFTARIFPDSRLNLAHLKQQYEEVNRTSILARLPTPPNTRDSGPGPKSHEPLIFLHKPYEDSALSRWPNPRAHVKLTQEITTVNVKLAAAKGKQTTVKIGQEHATMKKEQTTVKEEEQTKQTTEGEEQMTVKEEEQDQDVMEQGKVVLNGGRDSEEWVDAAVEDKHAIEEKATLK